MNPREKLKLAFKIKVMTRVLGRKTTEVPGTKMILCSKSGSGNTEVTPHTKP